jgi:hypothetical protein
VEVPSPGNCPVSGSTTKPIGFELFELFGMFAGIGDGSAGFGVWKGVPAVLGVPVVAAVLNGAHCPSALHTSIGWTLM